MRSVSRASVFVFIFVNSIWAQSIPFDIKIARDNSATILNSRHPGSRIGYRFFEHSPMPYGEIPLSPQQAGFDPQMVSQLEERYKNSPNVLVYTQLIPKDAHWAKQNWTFYMNPVTDGIEILLVVTTFGEGLPEYYGVQQCFRMTGQTNGSEWRKTIALTPAFSEYDMWAQEGHPRTSLSYVVRNGKWECLRAQKEAVGARTPAGMAIDFLRTNGQPEERVGPYQAEMLAPIDCPLITRMDKSGRWVCGIHWENTSHVTNHHPADCPSRECSWTCRQIARWTSSSRGPTTCLSQATSWTSTSTAMSRPAAASIIAVTRPDGYRVRHKSCPLLAPGGA